MEEMQQRVTESVRALAGWRRETNLDVAVVLGMSKSSANGKMIGRINWTLADMEKISNHYGVTFDQLRAGPEAWLNNYASVGLTPPYVYGMVA